MNHCMIWINTWLYDYENVHNECYCYSKYVHWIECHVPTYTLDQVWRFDTLIGIGCHILTHTLSRVSYFDILTILLWVLWEDHSIFISNCYWECGIIHFFWNDNYIYILYMLLTMLWLLIYIVCTGIAAWSYQYIVVVY